MKERGKLSIIVPVCNLEQYLPACIESVLRQNYADFELILVDDGSTDGSLSVCREYAQQDSRIRVLHKENGGVSSARNLGLEHATGAYISFVDGDDWIEPDLYERLTDDLDRSGAGIAACQLDRVAPDGTRTVIERPEAAAYGVEDVVSRFFENGFVKDCMYGPYNKIFRRECIGDIRFKPYAYGEDVLFVFETLSEAETVFIDDFVGYHYRQHSGSAMQSGFSLKRLDYVKAAREVEQCCARQFPRHAALAHRWVYGHALVTVRQLLRNGMRKSQKGYIAEEKRYFKANKKYLRGLPFRYRVLYGQVMYGSFLIRGYFSAKENA